MSHMRKAVDAIVKKLSKAERRLVVRSPIAFKKKIRKGSKFYPIGVCHCEPTPPTSTTLLRYGHNKQKIEYIYDEYVYAHWGYVVDYFWSGKIVVLDKTLAEKIYSELKKKFEESKEWQNENQEEKDFSAMYEELDPWE